MTSLSLNTLEMYAAEKSEDCPVVARTPATQRWISDCLLASMSQSRLNSLALLSIEEETTDFPSITDEFASMKARRVNL